MDRLGALWSEVSPDWVLNTPSSLRGLRSSSKHSYLQTWSQAAQRNEWLGGSTANTGNGSTVGPMWAEAQAILQAQAPRGPSGSFGSSVSVAMDPTGIYS